jgi:hypothetical protein
MLTRAKRKRTCLAARRSFRSRTLRLSALITAGVALLLLVVLRLRFITLSLVDSLLVAVVVGCSVLLWREAVNTGALNTDPISGVSPNDVLCPLVTYLFIGFYAAFRRPVDAIRFEQARVLLTLVSFVVNVVTI